LLGELPRGFVLKTGDGAVQRYARSALGVEALRSFTSFTASGRAGERPHAARSQDIEPSPIIVGERLDAAARGLFAQTIYDAAELEKYFANGARWFGRRVGERLVSGCFVFENFGPVWEVAGVFTEAAWRRQGLAAEVVRAAIEHLLERGLQPRYQVETSNVASVELARSLDLTEFIVVEHFVVCA